MAPIWLLALRRIQKANLAFCIRRNANGAMQIIHTLTLTLTLILTLNLTLISSYLTNKHQYTQPICPPICIAPFALRRIQIARRFVEHVLRV